MKVLVTGAAGFIGFHVVEQLLLRGDSVVGLDNINDYYDPELKYGRLEAAGIAARDLGAGELRDSGVHPGYSFVRCDLEDEERLFKLCEAHDFDVVCHLAAQAGVRYSLECPRAYVDSNMLGFLNVLEACRRFGTQHLVYASSSSVYGLNRKMPFAVGDGADHPVSLYAASKKSNELMAHAYSHLYGFPVTGLRFFTVYGPWGRPDMAPMLFARAISGNQAINVFNNGDMQRDFTFVDDIAEGVVRVLDKPPLPGPDCADPSVSTAPYRVHNIGNGAPVDLMVFIQALEEALGQEARKVFLPMQPGDVRATWADTASLREVTGFEPRTDVREGVGRFVRWYREYYGV